MLSLDQAFFRGLRGLRVSLGDRQLKYKCTLEKRSKSCSSSQRTKVATGELRSRQTKYAHPIQVTMDKRKRRKERRERGRRKGERRRRRNERRGR